MACTYYGRKRIFSKEETITADNVADVVGSCLRIHNQNAHDIAYLYDYYKGRQDILDRKKLIRDDICNKVIVNRAAQIVNFKRGFLLTKDIQYIRSDDAGKEQSAPITELNAYMKAEGKSTKDSVLAEWMYICGMGFRFVAPKKWLADNAADHDSEAPFEFYTLDPREAFIGYSREVGNKPLFACIRSTPVDTELEPNEYTVYTDKNIYKLKDDSVVNASVNPLGMIPVIEYDENNSRLGAFEIVLPILNEINNVLSNEIDDIEQTVQAILVLMGVDINEKDADGNPVNTITAIRERGGISLPEGADAKYLSLQLANGQTQSAINTLDRAWMEICGIPNRNGGNSTSDTGSAVNLRDGWESAETMASNTQTMWVAAEKDFLKIVLSIIKDNGGTDLKADEIEPHFNRQNAINIQSRVQAFSGLWKSGAINLHDCVMISGIAHDVETVTENGLAWYNEQQEKQEQQLQEAMRQSEETDNSDSEDMTDEES